MPALLSLSNKKLDPLVYAADNRGLSIMAIYSNPFHVTYLDRNRFIESGEKDISIISSNHYPTFEILIKSESRRLNEQCY